MDPNQDAQPPVKQDPFTNVPPNNNQPNNPASSPSSFAPQPQPEVISPTTPPPPVTPPAASPQSQPTPPATNSPSYQPGQVYSGSGGILPVIKQDKSPKKKRLLIGGILAAVILLGLGGVFAFYLPNKPENVWSAGLNRSGQTVDKLVVAATEEQKLAKVENSEFSGTAEANIDGETYKGSFNSRYDANQSNNSFSYKADGQSEDFNVKLLTDLAENQDYPDIYFQIAGLRSLGVDQYMPGAEKYDGKWISVSSAYLKSVVPTEKEAETDKNPQFTSQDAAELSRIVSRTTQEYVFTSEPDKAVLVRKSFVGTEAIENNISANHYIVGIHKENAKKYCRALIDSFMSAEAYKHIPEVNPATIDKDKQEAIKSCEEGVDKDIDDKDEFDMWIDKKRKLISKVRFTNTEEKGDYVEVGQTYTDGDVVPLFMKMHSDKDKYDGTITLEADMKNSITKGSLNFETTGDQKGSFKASFEFKPIDGDVTIEKPADAIPIEEVMKAFGVDPQELEDLSGTNQDF